ncbi:DUF262 domain-containing protein [Longispora sp. NPDC051575]|uniref:DUF262 domain-containing protein n=1 Tax=Longispora sp. NPDC051575 TaxID=3154943 RepID=UPI00341BAEF3
MQAQTLTPAEIFGHHTRYVVPLFQRPYVWNQVDQWEPLWSDVRTVADLLLEAPQGYGAPPVPAHFLGAIVLDQPATPTGYITARRVIDGQQRLTTLQLLLDAAQLVIQELGAPRDAQALRILVLNDPSIAQNDDEVFKAWPTDCDQDAFRAAMSDSLPVTPEQAGTPIVRAHQFFVDQITAWAQSGPQEVEARLNRLTMALRSHLKVVVIDLEPGDNAQVIFETLNHRGVPLLAADLIKNLLFQVAEAQFLDVRNLYDKYWAPLDRDYWRQRVARGRQYVPRIDVFVNYWLVMRLRKEVRADRIFADFRDHLRRDQQNVEHLLAELAADAVIFERMEALPARSVPGRFRYRVIQAMDSAVVTPVFLWLLRWPEADLPLAQRDKALGALESWFVRRALCRLTSKDVNRLLLDLLGELHRVGPAVAGDTAESFLSGQQANSRFWPSDQMVADAVRVAPMYKALVRARIRMLLEALEDDRRTDFSEGALCPRNLTVEHVLPQAWREHWDADGLDEAAAVRRDGLVHTMGNLTLVNKKLNPSMSNRPWTAAESVSRGLGGAGKRDQLLTHSTLKLNADIVADHPDAWTEGTIQARTADLAAKLCRIWARPTSAVVPEGGVLELAADLPEEEMPAAVHGFRPLTEWLQAQSADTLPVTFTELEDFLGAPLPEWARTLAPYWYSGGDDLLLALAAAGFKPTRVDLTDESLVLVRT